MIGRIRTIGTTERLGPSQNGQILRRAEDMPLVKKLFKVGDSACVILDKQLLKMAGMQPDSEVEIRVEGNTIVLAPHCYASDEGFREAKERVIRANRNALSRLAK